ncbi:hypothetical protein ACFPIJ_13550 [Dactylosporangium cerinum]|uniref:Secreted protein n=1 Tax=Dactylosporangium cerinum TaxID=1434730 RepID=A0ABV9VR59_9ACTN
MDDTLIRNALQSYVSDGPPMTVHSAGVLAAGRRARRRRRLHVAAGSAAGLTALAGVLVLALGLLPGQAAGPALPAGPSWAALDPSPFCTAASPSSPTTAPSSTVNEKNGHVIVWPTEPTDHAAARLSCYLLSEVPRRLPGVTFFRDQRSPEATVPLQVFHSTAGVPSFTSSAVVADGRGVGTIGFGSLPAYETPADATAGCHAPACTVRTGPHGELVTVVIGGSLKRGKVQLVNVRAYLGQTITFASATNADTGTGPAAQGQVSVVERLPMGRPDLPLSIDALVDIITAPELTLFP